MFVRYLLKRLDSKSDFFDKKKDIRNYVEGMNKVIHDMSKNEGDPRIYVTCFCENGDSSDLWRKFGSYSIGFDYKEINRLREEEYKKYGLYSSLFDRVVYYDEKNIPQDFEYGR